MEIINSSITSSELSIIASSLIVSNSVLNQSLTNITVSNALFVDSYQFSSNEGCVIVANLTDHAKNVTVSNSSLTANISIYGDYVGFSQSNMTGDSLQIVSMTTNISHSTTNCSDSNFVYDSFEALFSQIKMQNATFMGNALEMHDSLYESNISKITTSSISFGNMSFVSENTSMSAN